jgi:hypothetical protein
MTTPTLQTVLDQLHAEDLLGETERARMPKPSFNSLTAPPHG